MRENPFLFFASSSSLISDSIIVLACFQVNVFRGFQWNGKRWSGDQGCLLWCEIWHFLWLFEHRNTFTIYLDNGKLFQQFVDFLNVIHPTFTEILGEIKLTISYSVCFFLLTLSISERTLPHILALADRFQVEVRLFSKCADCFDLFLVS